LSIAPSVSVFVKQATAPQHATARHRQAKSAIARCASTRAGGAPRSRVVRGSLTLPPNDCAAGAEPTTARSILDHDPTYVDEPALQALGVSVGLRPLHRCGRHTRVGEADGASGRAAIPFKQPLDSRPGRALLHRRTHPRIPVRRF